MMVIMMVIIYIYKAENKITKYLDVVILSIRYAET